MSQVYDIVIIGAGAIGCSTAHCLAKQGIQKIAVLEMNQIGSGSSGKTASMFTLHLANELSIKLGKLAYDRFIEIEEEMATNLDINKIGFIGVATETNANELASVATMLKEQNVLVESLDHSSLRKLYPELHVDDIAFATWAPNDFRFDAHMLLQAYARGAKQRGVDFLEGTHARSIQVENGRVFGVSTQRGFISTRHIINAAGPWAGEVGGWTDTNIPILNSMRTIMVTAPFPHIPPERPCIEDMTVEWYTRPETDCMLMGMGASIINERSVAFDQSIVVPMVAAATHRIPVLEKASFMTGWTGLRPMTPDGYPLVGPVPSVEGLYVNIGWGGEGVMLSPVAGELATQEILQSQIFDLKTELLSPSRFLS